MPVYRSIRDLDWPLIVITLALCGLGILQIYSATSGTRWQDAWWKQIVWVGTGFVMMWVVSPASITTPCWGTRFLFVFGFGRAADCNGCCRQQGFRFYALDQIRRFTLQTSEFVKIVLILLVAST